MTASSEQPHPYKEFEGTATWKILDHAIQSLVENDDLQERTDRAYIVGSLCKALAESENQE